MSYRLILEFGGRKKKLFRSLMNKLNFYGVLNLSIILFFNDIETLVCSKTMSSSSRLVLVGLVAHHQTSVSTTLNVSFECLLFVILQ